MSEQNHIDWSKTTFDGSRREQLRRWRALTLRERLEALDRLTAHAERTRAMAAGPQAGGVREPTPGYRNNRGTNEIVLHGCTPTPLASYLKALAVLRLVAEQAGDPDATGCWRNDVFVLSTRLKSEELLEFFLERYQPTPLVAPWGARSGFFSGSSERTAREALSRIANSSIPRLERYREAIRLVQNLLKKHGFDVKASDERKLDLLSICRSELPDHILPWLDACYVLTAEGRKFPPLLGTGGNEGSGSYVSGFAQQVVACIVDRGYDYAIETSLFASNLPLVRTDQTPGHFSPPDAGGANASTGFDDDTWTNPWDYLLALEGTLLFASSATRRGEFSAPSFNFPFVVSPLAGGTAGYVPDEERPKKAKRQVMELWLPLWQRMCPLDEIRSLFSEGRATLKGRVVSKGLDFARAIAQLGIDRGISQFQRFSFLMRNGQSFFATPIERYEVCRNPQADLIDDLDRNDWLSRVQRLGRDDKAPNAFRGLANQLDAALFAMARRVDRQAVEQTLRLLGRIEIVAARSSRVREQVPPPLPMLTPGWARRADDGSAEFRIATALARLSFRSGVDGKRVVLGLRPHLVPVRLDGRSWDENGGLVCWNAGTLERNLAQLLHRRRLEAIRLGAEDELLASRTGATLEDVHHFFEGGTDDRRIAELAHGLACVECLELDPPKSDIPIALPSAYGLLKPFFTAESMLRALDWLPRDRSLRLPAEIPARLVADDVEAALRLAWQRLRALGIKLPGRQPPCYPRRGDGPRLLAALVIPLTFGETRRLLNRLDLAPETELEPTIETAD